jgi:hypothetical protein
MERFHGNEGDKRRSSLHWDSKSNVLSDKKGGQMTYTIDHEQVDKIRQWFDTGRGVKVWTNLEIASGASREVFTPADHETAPSWRYGEPKVLQVSDIEVRTSTVLQSFRGRFKAMYWGPWVQDATEKKAQRLCKYWNVPEDSWRWEPIGDGLVMVEILKSEVAPL